MRNRKVLQGLADRERSCEVVLEGPLDVSGIARLHEQLSTALRSGRSLSIDAAAVERIDTAAFQLLIAFVRDATQRDLQVRWSAFSEALDAGANDLDIARLLGLPQMVQP